MNPMNWLIHGDYAAVPTDLMPVLLAGMLAFLAGQLLAAIYMLTHPGLSYSRSFVSALSIMPVLVALVMVVFAIVRFRNILRDTLDTSYLLSSIVVGMACGTQKFTTAVLGTAIVSGILLYLWFVGFGSRHRYDVILNIRWDRPLRELADLTRLLDRHGLQINLASQRSHEASQGTDLSYRILLRDPSRVVDLTSELQSLEGVARLTSIKAEDESEL
jgi:hypothetical protein